MEMQLSPLLRHELLELVTKRTSLIEHLNSLRTLVVGSSHGDFGFNPAFVPDSFNLCSPSQDLRHSDLLAEKMSRMNPAIANIVVFYSAFSPGHQLEKTSERESARHSRKSSCSTPSTPIRWCWKRTVRLQDGWAK